jgi:hypothetical protein
MWMAGLQGHRKITIIGLAKVVVLVGYEPADQPGHRVPADHRQCPERDEGGGERDGRRGNLAMGQILGLDGEEPKAGQQGAERERGEEHPGRPPAGGRNGCSKCVRPALPGTASRLGLINRVPLSQVTVTTGPAAEASVRAQGNRSLRLLRHRSLSGWPESPCPRVSQGLHGGRVGGCRGSRPRACGLRRPRSRRPRCSGHAPSK